MSGVPAPGDVFRVPFPFHRVEVSLMSESGPYETMSWKPGVQFEDYGPEDVQAVADGVGTMVLVVVDSYKPGPFPCRVFYTRFWVSPDGREFGKNGLHIATLQKFRRISKQYQHPFVLRAQGTAA